MFHTKTLKLILIDFLAIITLWPSPNDCLIITSVIAGDKKFKTVSFHSKFIKPLMFESELPTTEFRRHRTMRPPKFDIDVNIPIKLPLEDEYPQDDYVKPVENNFFFQTGEIKEPSYKKPDEYQVQKQVYPKQQYNQEPRPKITYKDDIYSAASQNNQIRGKQQTQPETNPSDQQTQFDDAKVKRRDVPDLQISPSQSEYHPENQFNQLQQLPITYARSNVMKGQDLANKQKSQIQQNQQVREEPQSQESLQAEGSGNNYAKQYDNNYGSSYYQKEPEFIPGGYVNLKLNGPTGGPHMTYEDYDREKWAQQLSQTLGAMPYPILNYQQLQNFYGGLGTFTNGLADNRYAPMSILEKLTSGFHHIKDKLHQHLG